jgi:hypothetical protein
MSEATMLKDHGTVLMRLKPVNIIQAAIADLKLRAAKEAKEADVDKPYSFHRRHVRRARNVHHLIALAYYEPWAADSTDKTSTLVVYSDRDLLRQVLIDLLQGVQDA